MPNLLDKLILHSLSDIEKPETSLIELLTGATQDQTENVTTQVVATQQSKKNQAGKKTRSSRKSSSRRANTRQKARRAPPMQVSAQLSLISDLQERNNKQLESYKLQAASTSLTKDTLEFTGTIEQAASSTSSLASAKVDGVEVSATMRPVILAFMDYLPIADSSGNNNETSNIINYKINARQLALENLPEEIAAAEQAQVSLSYLDEYKKFLKYREVFFDNLDVSKIGADDGTTYREALSFLEISSESAEGASNTPILLTFLRDYASAVMTASPRLLELAEVEFGGGTSLASRRSTDGFRVTLRSTIDYIRTTLGEDREIALKSLVYQLGSELKLSRNNQGMGDTFDANEIFETPRGRGTMKPAAVSSAATGATTTAAKEDSFGIVNSIQNLITGDISYEFPFEIADILGLSAAQGSEILSAPDFIRQLLASPDTSATTSSSSSSSSATSQVSATTPIGMAASVGSGATPMTAVTTPSYIGVTTSPTTTTTVPSVAGDALAAYTSAQDALGCGAGAVQQAMVQHASAVFGQSSSTGASGAVRMGGMVDMSSASPTASIQYEDPYAAINLRALQGISLMERLIRNDGYSIDGVPSTIILKLIVDNVVEPLVTGLYNEFDVCDTLVLSQLLFLDLAAKDQDMMGQFLLYLTRLEEKLNQPIISESSTTAQVDSGAGSGGGNVDLGNLWGWGSASGNDQGSWFDKASQDHQDRLNPKNPMVSKNTLVSAMSTPTQISSPASTHAITELTEDVGFSNAQTAAPSTTSVTVSAPSLSVAVLSSNVVASGVKAMAAVASATDLTIVSLPEDPIDLSFEDLCTVLGQTIYTQLESSAADSSSTSGITAITPENITRALMVQAENAMVNTTLRNLLSLFQTVVSNIEGGHEGIGCFHSDVATREEVTRYSSIPRGNMEVAFYEAVARTTNVIFSRKYSSVQTSSGLGIKASSAMADRLGGRITDFIQQEGMYLTSGGNSWATSESSGGSGIQLDVSRAQAEPGLHETLTGQTSVSAALDDSYSVAEETAVVTQLFDRVYNAVIDEEKFVEDFPAALRVYFSNVDSAFTSCKSILSEGVSDSSSDSLKGLALQGLEICPDMYTNLHNLQETSNSDTGMLNGVRTREVLLDDTAKSFMSGQLKAPLFTDNQSAGRGKLKFMTVGVPAGMLEALSFDPVAITDLARNKSGLSKDYFEVRIEKIDLTRAERNYKAKTFVFPRRVLFNSWVSTGGGASSETGIAYPEIMIAGKRMKYDVYNEDTYASAKTNDSVDFLETYHSASMINLKNDIALKLYSDVLYNLDFSTSAFPSSTTALEAIICPTTTPINMELVDLTTETFMSRSCLTFMSAGGDAVTDYEPVLTMATSTTGLDIPVLSLVTHGSMSLAGTLGSTLSVAAFPFYDFVSTVGDTVVNGHAEVMLKLGTNFERVLCVPFDPSDFEIEMKTMGSGATLANITNQEMDIAEETVPYGLETSQGVELCTFRVSIVIPDEGEYEQ